MPIYFPYNLGPHLKCDYQILSNRFLIFNLQLSVLISWRCSLVIFWSCGNW